MWTNNEIEDFKQKLKGQKMEKRDYVTPCTNIQTQYDIATKTIKLRVANGDTSNPLWFDMNNWMHNQVAEKCHIYKPFYEWLLENNHQELLTTNINELIKDKEKRMVRTIGGTARALVSDQYRPIDNYDMFEFFTDAIADLNTTANMDIQIEKCEVTDTRIYIRAISNRLTDEIFGDVRRDLQGKLIKDGLKRGDIVNGGIQLSNSEVGAGSYCVEPFIFVVKCSNGLISDQSLRRRHIGKKLEEQVIDYSTRTMSLDDELLWSKLTDMVYSTFNPEKFRQWVTNINEVAGELIENPIVAVNHVVKSYKQFSKESHEQLLTRFAQYGFTRWGLTQAVTDYAQTVKSFDQRVELERIGNEILLETPIEVLQAKTKESNGNATLPVM